MRRRTPLVLAGLCVVATGALAPASAAPTPKPYTTTTTYTDRTPDPTGGLGANCQGLTPPEAPVEMKVANPGVVTLSITGFTGDWALVVRDKKDSKLLGASDTNPPATENVIVTLKKATTLLVQPCNLGGTVDATLKLAYRFKKP